RNAAIEEQGNAGVEEPDEGGSEVDAKPVASVRDVAIDRQPTRARAPSEDSIATDTAAIVEAEVPADRRRIAILTPGGPLLVDAALSMDGQPLQAAFDALVQQVLDDGDSDGDGKATWQELIANEQFLSGPLANLPSGQRRQARMWTDRYDENGDDLLQPEEVNSWLGRDAGRSLASLSLRSRRSYFPSPAANSRLWKVLDRDGDATLSSAEIEQAPNTLRALDEDDNQVVSPDELAALRDQISADDRMRRSASSASLPAAVELDGRREPQRLEYLFSDVYSPRQPLGPDSFPALRALFTQLDEDSSGELDPQEVAALGEVDPHLDVSIAFEPQQSTEPASASLQVQSVALHVLEVDSPMAGRTRVDFGGTRVVFSAHDLSPPMATDTLPPQQSSQRNAVRLMVHDRCDALLAELDVNGDGSLGDREITNCGERLRSLDADRDSLVEAAETPYLMIVAFLRGEAPTERSFYTPAPSIAARLTLGPHLAWFVASDFNGDGDVSRREFLGSMEQFEELDENHDGFIETAEAIALESAATAGE
ncbi:MAG: hypothetical protein AAF961_11325, partial [Planctomycetota bacterium]